MRFTLVSLLVTSIAPTTLAALLDDVLSLTGGVNAIRRENPAFWLTDTECKAAMVDFLEESYALGRVPLSIAAPVSLAFRYIVNDEKFQRELSRRRFSHLISNDVRTLEECINQGLDVPESRDPEVGEPWIYLREALRKTYRETHESIVSAFVQADGVDLFQPGEKGQILRETDDGLTLTFQ